MQGGCGTVMTIFCSVYESKPLEFLKLISFSLYFVSLGLDHMVVTDVQLMAVYNLVHHIKL